MSGLSFTKIIKTLPLLLLILVTPLLKSTNALDQGLLIRFIGLQFIMLLILVMVLMNRGKNTLKLRSSLLTICFLFVFYTGIHLLWGNVYSDSIFDWLKTVSYFMLLFFLIQLYSYNELKSASPMFISLLGIILATYGLIELFQLLQTGKLNIPLSTYQIKTVFGHRNLYVQILFLSFPFQAYQIFTTKSRFLRILYVVFAGVTLFLLIILSNRTVWLALIIGVVTVVIMDLFRKRKNITPTFVNSSYLKIIAPYVFIVLLISGFFFTFFTEPSEAEEHFGNIVKLEKGSGKDRLELWERTLKIIEEKPLFGYGAANWKIEMLKYGSKGLVSEDNITFYQRPHNDFLWISSEFGIMGGLIYLLVFIWAFVLLISQINIERDKINVLFSYAVLYSLTGITIFSFLSFPHERIIHNILLSLFFAVIITGYSNKKRLHFSKRGISVIVYFAAIILLTVSIVYGYQRYISETHTRTALLAKMENHHSIVIDEINKAVSPYYQMDPLSTPLLWYKGLALYQLGEIDSAVLYLQKAKQLNPYHVHVLNNLASAYAQKGETKKAIKSYKEAIKIYPEFEEASFNLCAVYFNTGQTDSAFAVLTEININTQNTKYKTFLKAVLTSKITTILKDKRKEDMITSLPDDEEWYYQLYSISVSENIPIENLIFEDAIFNK